MLLMSIEWSTKDGAVDFGIPSTADHIIARHKNEVIEMLDQLKTSLKNNTYPFKNIPKVDDVITEKYLYDIITGKIYEIRGVQGDIIFAQLNGWNTFFTKGDPYVLLDDELFVKLEGKSKEQIIRYLFDEVKQK